MSTTKHTATPKAILQCAECSEPIKGGAETCDDCGSSLMEWRPATCVETKRAAEQSALAKSLHDDGGYTWEQAVRWANAINACAKFPDPAAALTDLRLLLGQARGLLAEGDTDKADKMLIAMLGVLDGEDV